jgi:NAD(P)-dependent dehydrogenase (short-subunit alcohol dehydrogenase family)
MADWHESGVTRDSLSGECTTLSAMSTASDVIAGHDLHGKEAIVTGGSSGLGAETAQVLANAGARVVLASRNRVRGEAAANRMRRAIRNGCVEFQHLDLGSLASVASFAHEYLAGRRPLHLLINNAGILTASLSYTEDGFESQFGINHVGHFALTTALLPALKAAGTARVVCLSSRAHRHSDIDFGDPNYHHRAYDLWRAYGQSKTANTLFAVGLTLQHGSRGVTANAVVPGAVPTGLQRYLSRGQLISTGWVKSGDTLIPGPDWKTIAQGAATTIWAAVAPELHGIGGCYLENCAFGRPWTKDTSPPNGYYLPYALDASHAERLWELSRRLGGE